MDYAALLQLAATMYGQEQANQMTKKQLDILGQQIARVQGVPLPDLPKTTADELGPSALGSMAPDEAMRGKQLGALADLQNIIDHGGTDLTMENSLEQAVNSANTQQNRAREGVAANMAARGQYNSGARMLMDMNASQTGANAARSSGLDAAAAASKRRMDAINEAASMESGMRNQDWGEKAQAAGATDMRAELNRNAREKAQYYNAGIPQQNFNNAMSKATGTGNPTNALAGALQNAGANAALNGANIGAASAAAARGGVVPPAPTNTYTYDPKIEADTEGNRHGHSDIPDSENDK